MKVLITGITGFIGSRLSIKLANIGWEVAGLVRPTRKDESRCLYEYDGTYTSVKKAIDLFEPQAIIHLATTYSASNDSDSLDKLASTNILLPLFLLEASKTIQAKIVCAGSYWQFGNQGDSSPLDIYAATKTAADHIIDYYTSREGIWATVMYFYGTYGSNDDREKILDNILQSAVTGKKLLLSPGEQKLNLVHVDDIARSIKMVLTNDRLVSGVTHKFGVYSGNSYTLKEIISICQEYSERPLDVEFGAVPYRDRELMEPQYPYSNVPDWNENVLLKDFIKHFLKTNQTP